jgi:hypothetical protein
MDSEQLKPRYGRSHLHWPLTQSPRPLHVSLRLLGSVASHLLRARVRVRVKARVRVKVRKYLRDRLRLRVSRVAPPEAFKVSARDGTSCVAGRRG